ncbi:hypothetical protein AFB00_14220 [Pseudonocardia sp. HH130630-07]|nr:hypothetical protein AFB00_14220 [Pseudonocardia sp. HH130630-07]
MAEVDAARIAVGAAESRGLPIMLAATGVLTFLDFAAKDEIASPRRRRLVTGIIQTAIAGIGMLEARANPVNPFAIAPVPQPAAFGRYTAVAAGWYADERLAVHLLRRSRLSRPNTVAGALLAVSRPVGTLVAIRMMPRVDDRA